MMDPRPLKIVLFSNLFPPIPSGSSTFTWELSRRLSACNHRVTVITARVEGAPDREVKDDVHIYRLPSIRLPQLALAHNFRYMTYTYTPGNIRFLKRLFRDEQFEVIHQQNHVFDTILSSSHFARTFRLPLVLTVHTPVQHPNPLFDKVLFALDAVSRKVIFDQSDSIVSPDPVSKRYVETRHRVKASPIIPYGIDVLAPNPADIVEVRQRWGLDGKLVLLSLGHVNGMRNRMDLIQAMPAVVQRFPNVRLLIVGEVGIQEPVKAVKCLGLENYVIFTGSISHEQIPAYFALSSLEAHTFSGSYPGPGIASLEAMAAGLPVMTGEIAPEYDYNHLRNWENVVFVPVDQPEAMAQSIIRLLSDEVTRRHIGESARQMIAKMYSWDVVCNAYVNLYRQLIEQNSHVGSVK
jgi:glycosyltransferase involved in cell wall biosynthesis